MPALLLVAVVAALAGGCTEEDLSDASFVSGLRILGAQAEPPEAMPGDTVKLTAWVVDTKSASVDVTWSACMLPSNGLANAGCTDGSGNGLVAIGSGATSSFVVPPIEAETLGPTDATNGVYLPLVIHARAGDDSADAIYRLRITVAAVPGCTLFPPFDPGCGPNHNPSIDRIDPLSDEGTPIVTHEGVSWAMIARYSADSAEEYEIPSTTMPDVFERLITQWFATAGTFPNQPVGGTAVQKLTMDRALPPSGGTIDLWVVGHDERGGSTMAHRTFILQ
jgi:hypothetical protein